MRCHRSLLHGLAAAWAASIAFLAPQVGFAEVLTVEKGPNTGEVVLSWTGGTAPWDVFRSNVPVSVTAPASMLGTTATTSWTDSPPTGESPLFYLVRSCGTPAPPEPRGCATCDICDPWGLSWASMACADRYIVRWKCVFHVEQAWTVFGTSVGDICFDIGMCDQCGAGVEYIRVEACGAAGCSVAASVPISETPSQCGGGCCVPR